MTHKLAPLRLIIAQLPEESTEIPGDYQVDKGDWCAYSRGMADEKTPGFWQRYWGAVVAYSLAAIQNFSQKSSGEAILILLLFCAAWTWLAATTDPRIKAFRGVKQIIAKCLIAAAILIVAIPSAIFFVPGERASAPALTADEIADEVARRLPAPTQTLPSTQLDAMVSVSISSLPRCPHGEGRCFQIVSRDGPDITIHAVGTRIASEEEFVLIDSSLTRRFPVILSRDVPFYFLPMETKFFGAGEEPEAYLRVYLTDGMERKWVADATITPYWTVEINRIVRSEWSLPTGVRNWQ